MRKKILPSKKTTNLLIKGKKNYRLNHLPLPPKIRVKILVTLPSILPIMTELSEIPKRPTRNVDSNKIEFIFNFNLQRRGLSTKQSTKFRIHKHQKYFFFL